MNKESSTKKINTQNIFQLIEGMPVRKRKALETEMLGVCKQMFYMGLQAEAMGRDSFGGVPVDMDKLNEVLSDFRQVGLVMRDPFMFFGGLFQDSVEKKRLSDEKNENGGAN